MPIISLEPFLFPEELFMAKHYHFSLNTVPATDARWWVLRTRPRCEKALARSLLNQGISFFLPLFERRHRLQGRRVVSHLPLFAGYVFLHATTDDRLAALKTNRVVSCLHVTDDEQSQLYTDLRRFYALMERRRPFRRRRTWRREHRLKLPTDPSWAFAGPSYEALDPQSSSSPCAFCSKARRLKWKPRTCSRSARQAHRGPNSVETTG